jgi:5-methyltetrahydropteroyltriglutamate--homocysteine methyltransferase
MGVGSYASPSWLVAAREKIRDRTFGADDIEETLADATRIAVADQLEAGVDIVSDGEMRRQRFVYEMFDRLAGLERVPAGRRVGVPGYDMAPHFTARERVTAPAGLGVVAEWQMFRSIVPPGVASKVALPGPVTFLLGIEPEPAYGAGGRARLLEDLVHLVRTEIEALIAADARYVQLDEPALTRLPAGLSLDAAVDAVNGTLHGLSGRLAVHVCFGNNAGRPNAERSLRRLQPAIRRLACAQLVLEFANREMAEIDLLGELCRTHEIAAGVVDVKSFYEETADDVARRIERALEFVPPERLTVTADCGFSALPRWLARRKLVAMVEGARRVRATLASRGTSSTAPA